MVRFARAPLFAGLLAVCQASPNWAADDEVNWARLRTAENKRVVGPVLSENEGMIEVLDLHTGEEAAFDKPRLLALHTDLTEERAIRDAGSAAVFAWRLIEPLQLEPVEARVAEVTSAGVVLNVGSEHGVHQGQEFFILGEEKVVTDPESGDVLTRRRPRIGTLRIRAVHPKYAVSQTAGSLELPLQQGQAVVSAQASKRVAVLPFLNSSGTAGLVAERTTEEMAHALVTHGASLVDRADLDRVLDEVQLQQDARFDPEKAQRIGQLAGAEVVVIGKLLPEGRFQQLFVKLVSVKTGEVLLGLEGPLVLTSRSSSQSGVRAVPEPAKAYLVDMQEFGVVRGPWGYAKGKLGVNGPPFSKDRNGFESPHGIGMHPPSRGTTKAKYRLGKRFGRFEAEVIISPANRPGRTANSPVTFSVLGDGKLLWKSKPMKKCGQRQRCEIDVSDVNTLELRVSCPGSAVHAHACWIEPALVP